MGPHGVRCGSFFPVTRRSHLRPELEGEPTYWRRKPTLRRLVRCWGVEPTPSASLRNDAISHEPTLILRRCRICSKKQFGEDG